MVQTTLTNSTLLYAHRLVSLVSNKASIYTCIHLAVSLLSNDLYNYIPVFSPCLILYTSFITQESAHDTVQKEKVYILQTVMLVGSGK